MNKNIRVITLSALMASVASLTACGEEPVSKTAPTAEASAPVEKEKSVINETASSALDKAKNVEAITKKSAEDMDKALEEASK